ncbi:putative RecA-like recombination protein [Campylobacter phage F356]|uniref:Putative RecA-like recombination protein n=2 Tax=Fletchervirus CPX TaxID=1110702 RepID=A0A7T3KEG1_9CAUD|nr:putative RecA-like recombination protein [Campylobacter phage F355]QPX63747.1 putative RecA-like recombination protein [Campylobacter phage F356]
MSLINKLLKNSTLKDRTNKLENSKYFGKTEFVETPVPMLNLALSGKINGGLTPGLTVIAGPSKHFKSNYALVMMASYLQKYPDAVCIFYDSEFGITPDYMENFGIDTTRVIHTPVMNVEELKFDIANQLENIEDGDRVIIILDSLGNLASKAEIENAINEKSVVDMQRSKHIKSLFRIVTPYLSMKQIPMVVVNHTYDDIGSLWGGQVVSGGTGVIYSADTIFIIGKAQEKDSKKNLQGWQFTINVEKSRFIKEKSKIPILVTFDNGINKWSGLADLGLELGFLQKQGDSHFNPFTEKKLYLKSASQEQLDEFFSELLSNKDFVDALEYKYSLLNVTPNNETTENNV